MANSTTLTIRLDDNLKNALEEAARLEDRSVTEFVVRAIKARMAPQCMRCGRADTPTVLPAGLTPAMDSFLEERRGGKYGYNMKVVLTTIEGTQKFSYWGCVRNLNEDTHGIVMLEVGGTGVSIPIPRGLITGWGYDQEARQHRILLALGYANGNAPVEHLMTTIANQPHRG